MPSDKEISIVAARLQRLINHAPVDPSDQIEDTRTCEREAAAILTAAEQARREEPFGLHWRADEYGAPDRALYCGALFIGSVLKWNNHTPRNTTPWRAWFMSCPDGAEVGWFATGEEARSAVEQKARAAIAAMDRPGWQPIETAPKDGMLVWLFYPGAYEDDQQVAGRWNTQDWLRWEDRAGANKFIEPTHWMPLPTPPEGE